MPKGEKEGQATGCGDILVEEDPLPGDEDILQDDQCFMPSEVIVAHIDVSALKFARVAGLSAVNEDHAWTVGRYGARDRIVLLSLAHPECGHDQHLVGVGNARDVGLGTADHDPIALVLHYVHKHVPIGLFAGGNAAITFDISHGTGHAKVVVMDIFKPNTVHLSHFVVSLSKNKRMRRIPP